MALRACELLSHKRPEKFTKQRKVVLFKKLKDKLHVLGRLKVLDSVLEAEGISWPELIVDQ